MDHRIRQWTGEESLFLERFLEKMKERGSMGKGPGRTLCQLVEELWSAGNGAQTC